MVTELPRLSLSREVTNISPGHIDRIQQGLVDANRFEEDVIAEVINKASSQRASLVHGSEMRKLYDAVDLAPSQDTVRELGDYLLTLMGATLAEPLETQTLPSRYCRISKKTTYRTVFIGSSPTIKSERVVAKHAVLRFYGIPYVPRGVWLDDNKAAGVSLAHSNNAREREVLSFMHEMIQREPGLLPPKINLAPAKVHIAGGGA